MTRLDPYRESDIYRCTAIGVGRCDTEANEGLSLAVAGDIALGVIKKFYSERRARRAV